MLRNLAITTLLAAPVAAGVVIGLKAIDAPFGVALIAAAGFAAAFGYVGSILEDRRRGRGSAGRRRRPSGDAQAHGA